MPRTSAGLLLYRSRNGGLEVLLVHPGGPFWASRDLGAWSIPKGEFEPGAEDPPDVARREFAEEIGVVVPDGPLLDLGIWPQPSGKRVHAFAVRARERIAFAGSNEFQMEWPPRSGRVQSFPEIDRAEWFTLAEARSKVVSGQVPILDALGRAVHENGISG
jgi:predicted NUDIX family NTP pyrophosphohydrolase